MSNKAPYDFKSVLPPHSTYLERALEIASFWVVCNSEIIDIWSPTSAPEQFLPWLAWSVSVDEWDENWPVEIKRDVILASHKIHRIKGTRGAVQKALDAMGFEAEITEWWEPGGSGVPYTFEITAYARDVLGAGTQMTPELLARVTRAVEDTKSLRSHFTFVVSDIFRVTEYVRSHTDETAVDCLEHDFQSRRFPGLDYIYTRSLLTELVIDQRTEHVFSRSNA